MFCNYCGAPNPDYGRFCAICGKGVMPTAPSISGNPPQFAETEMGLQSGFLLMNRYRVRREIGLGGMGRVYLADDETLRIPVAIKVLRDLLSRDPGSVLRLKKEAKLAIQLSHPNIVRVHDYHEADIIKFLVMEYLDGETLAHRLARENALSEADVRGIAATICAGLEHAHEKRIIHRDLKPGNILLGKDGAMKISDFGIARVCRDSMSRLTSQFDSGTLIYMSPEQLMGESTEQSDIYSLGVIMYELVSGEVPFHSGDIHAQIRGKKPRTLAEISPEFNDLIMQCLSKTPRDRPQTAVQLRQRIQETTTIHKVDGRPAVRFTVADAASTAPSTPDPPGANTAGPIKPETIAKRPPRPAAGLASEQVADRPSRPALRGALAFGLGSIPAAECIRSYPSRNNEPFLLALLFLAILFWGIIAAKVTKRSVKAFACGFALFGAGLVFAISMKEYLYLAILFQWTGLGLAAAGMATTALMRRPPKTVLFCGAAFALFPIIGLSVWRACADVLPDRLAFTFAIALCSALSGALFALIIERQP